MLPASRWHARRVGQPPLSHRAPLGGRRLRAWAAGGRVGWWYLIATFSLLYTASGRGGLATHTPVTAAHMCTELLYESLAYIISS